MDSQTTKFCPACSTPKAVEAFHKCSSFKDGRYNICGECRQKTRRRDTPAATVRRERAALKAQGLKRCNACGVPKAIDTEFYVRKSGVVSPICKVCDVAQSVARASRDRVAANARHKRWRDANPEKAGANGRKGASARRARIKGVFIEHVDPRVVYEMHGGRCGLCEQFIEGAFDVDHVVPLAQGGVHGYVNVQPAHVSCNRSKGRAVALAGKE